MESIRRVRKHLDMTLAQVAEHTGLSISFLSDLERGRTDPSLSTLRKIASCYGVPVASLLEEKEHTMVVLEIIGFRGVPLPKELQHVFKDWSTFHTEFYTIYTIKLDYLGDEHIEPLDRAYKGKLIAHWESNDDWSASTYNV